MGQLHNGSLVNLCMVEGSAQECALVRNLFAVEDVRKYYVLSKDQAENLDSFVDYLAKMNANKRALNYVIEQPNGTQVGIITAEPTQWGQNVMWNIGYAILPVNRRHGYCIDAMNCLMSILKTYDIPLMMLDIQISNSASIAIAEKLGFNKVPFPLMDSNHLDKDMHFRWLKDVCKLCKRDQLNVDANRCFDAKNYNKAIELLEQSLKEPYVEGTLYTDAQIYSNLGMAYSSVKRYKDAYNALMKAYNMGIQNAPVIKELNWLRENEWRWKYIE